MKQAFMQAKLREQFHGKKINLKLVFNQQKKQCFNAKKK